MKSDLIPSINFPFQTFQPVLDGYRNKCEFTIAEGPDGGRTVIRHAHSANLAPEQNPHNTAYTFLVAMNL